MKNKKGFSLLELSIAITIIGFLIAAVVSSQRLIEDAKLTSIANQLRKIQQANLGFKLKYNTVPGDYSKATTLWSHANLANGNDNGEIDGNYKYTSTTEGSQPASTEMANAWLHLKLSNFYTSKLVGSLSSSAPSAQVGVNVEPAAIKTSFYILWDGASPGGSLAHVKNMIHLGTLASSDNSAMGAILTPGQAKKIDTKIDDAIADNGNLLSFDGNGTTSGYCGPIWASTGSYNLAKTTNTCRIVYKID